MLLVAWSDNAINDLAQIVDYIEQRNPLAADRLHRDIVRTVEQLPSYPYMYRQGRIAGTREALVHPNYLVVYCVGASTINVLRVLHARQQYP